MNWLRSVLDRPRIARCLIFAAAAGCWACGVLNPPPDGGPSASEMGRQATADRPAATATSTPAVVETGDGITISSSKRLTERGSLDVLRQRVAAKERQQQGLPPREPEPTPTVAVVRLEDGVTSAAALGLMWFLDTSGVVSYEDASYQCSTLRLTEFSDWRLPSIDELTLLFAHGFLEPQSRHVELWWSASNHPARGHWALDTNGGRRTELDAGKANVVCVRDIR